METLGDNPGAGWDNARYRRVATNWTTRMSDEPAQAFLADDHWTVIMGLKGILEHHGISVSGHATTADALIEHCSQGLASNEVIVLDLSLDATGGRETYHRIKEAAPDAKVLVLSMRESINTIRTMYELGVDGYITKSAPPDETAKAVRTVARGDSYYMEGVAEKVLQAQRHTTEVDPHLVLTKRELEILRYTALQYSTEEIAEAIGVSAKNVANRQSQIRHKLGGRPYTEFGWLARKYGVVELEL